MDDEIEKFLRDHETCFDRFAFDKIFRFPLENDFEHEDAKDLILYNCALSALVVQERIENEFYLKINSEEQISDDLLNLKNEYFQKQLKKLNKLN